MRFRCHKRHSQHVVISSEPTIPLSTLVFHLVNYIHQLKMSSISVLRRDERSSSDSPHGYIPTEWICILFIVLFSCTSLLHTVQAIRYRCIIPYPYGSGEAYLNLDAGPTGCGSYSQQW
jgi:hypothetical protein